MTAQDSELHRAVGRIEGKLDAFIVKLTDGEARQEQADKRLGAVERKQSWYAGAAAMFGSLVALVFHRAT